MSSVEFSNSGRPNMEAYRSLAKQAGMTVAEFRDNVEAGGMNAAVRHAAERASKRKRDPRRLLLELLRRPCP